jgi:hypothetical protein
VWTVNTVAKACSSGASAAGAGLAEISTRSDSIDSDIRTAGKRRAGMENLITWIGGRLSSPPAMIP